MENTYDVFACGCETHGSGVYRYTLHGGKLEEKRYAELSGAMFVCRENDRLYVIARNYESLASHGFLYVSDISEGMLTSPEFLCSTDGAVPCHASVLDGKVYAANYISGNAVCIDTHTGKHTLLSNFGKGERSPRQDAAHTHQVIKIPGTRQFAICDLGLDKIFVCDENLRKLSSVSGIPGHGTRHLAFTDDAKTAYCINELCCTVSRYTISGNVFTLCETIPIFDEGTDISTSTAAAIKLTPDGRHLYASVRGNSIIAHFTVNHDGTLVKDSEFDPQGSDPRDFDISPDGKTLICANQSGNLSVFDIQADGKLCYTGNSLDLPGALCVTITQQLTNTKESVRIDEE